MKMKFVLLGL